MNRDELMAGIESKLRGLRSCDTQATAVAWMAGAYKLMEECLEQLKDRPATVVHEKLVFVPERPKLEIVQTIPKQIAHVAIAPKYRDKTVVYPEMYLHPGLKPSPKAWTRADTLRLEKAVRTPAAVVQRRGR